MDISEAARQDLSRLAQRIGSDKISFKDFAEHWKELGLSFAHIACWDPMHRSEILQELYQVALDMIASSSLPVLKVCGAFSLYSFYHTHQLSEQQRIRVTVPVLSGFVSAWTALRAVNEEAHACMRSLYNDGAFHFVYMQFRGERHFAQAREAFRLLWLSSSHFEESATGNVLSSGDLSALKNTHDEYQALKTALFESGSVPQSSLSHVPAVVEDITALKRTFIKERSARLKEVLARRPASQTSSSSRSSAKNGNTSSLPKKSNSVGRPAIRLRFMGATAGEGAAGPAIEPSAPEQQPQSQDKAELPTFVDLQPVRRSLGPVTRQCMRCPSGAKPVKTCGKCTVRFQCSCVGMDLCPMCSHAMRPPTPSEDEATNSSDDDMDEFARAISLAVENHEKSAGGLLMTEQGEKVAANTKGRKNTKRARGKGKKP